MIHKRVEWRPQRFAYKLSPFPFPLLVIFSPFPQTESDGDRFCDFYRSKPKLYYSSKNKDKLRNSRAYVETI